MNSKESLNNIKNLFIGSPINPTQQFEIIEKDLEILEILKKKGVAVGFIQLQIKENCGGVREYNDYIGGDKSLHLTADEYEKIKEWLENE